jgi:hypothetical protein
VSVQPPDERWHRRGLGGGLASLGLLVEPLGPPGQPIRAVLGALGLGHRVVSMWMATVNAAVRSIAAVLAGRCLAGWPAADSRPALRR